MAVVGQWDGLEKDGVEERIDQRETARAVRMIRCSCEADEAGQEEKMDKQLAKVTAESKQRGWMEWMGERR